MSSTTSPDTLTVPPPLPRGARGFAGLEGQPAAVTALGRAIRSGRLPHSLLFTGPAGVGKASTAGILAQAQNCPEAGPADACGACVSCSKVARGLHPDIHWLAPAPRIVSMEAVREAIRSVAYSPHEGVRRVVVIDQAHAMRHDAQNAFLKTLEEPPGDALIVLVTPAPHSLLATVRSRCQSLPFAPLPAAIIRELLTRDHEIEESEARLRAALSPGSLGRALALDLDRHRELLTTVVDALRLAQTGGAGVVAAAESLAAVGIGETSSARAASTLRVAREVLRDVLVTVTGAGAEILLHSEQAGAWQAWAETLDRDRVIAALEAANAGVERLTTGIPPNVKLSLEQTLLAVGDRLGTLEPAR